MLARNLLSVIVIVAVAPLALAEDHLPTPDYRPQPSDPAWLGQVVQLHGHLGPAVVAGARLGMIGLRAVQAKGYFDVAVTCEGPLARPPQACFLDGRQAATGATLGKRSLTWIQADQIAVRIKNTRTGETAEVRPTPALVDLLGAFKPQPQAAREHGPRQQDHERLEAIARKIAAMPEKEVAVVTTSKERMAGNEVTLKGMVLNNVHTGEKQASVFIYALAGTPEITAEVERIMAQNYPERGLDGEAARKLQDQFTAKLKYFIDGPHAEELYKKATYGARQPTVLTGVIAARDGKRWITVSKYADTTLRYPARMLAADKPLVMPNQSPLLLKINERLALKCIWVPPGKFFMGEPYYQCPHWQEAPPHMVTLSKGFYMAEHPVTQEMFEAAVGSNPSLEKAAQAPVNASCVEMYKFCRILSQKSGRYVRPPTAAEWEYAARVGTSNPAFREKYKDQDSSGVQPPVVKSRPANAWGFYDMVSSGWERISDSSTQLDRQDMADPRHIPPEDEGAADPNRKHGHFARGNAQYAVSELEYISSDRGPENTYPGVIRFRVVVEGHP